MSDIVRGVRLWLALPDAPRSTTARRVAKRLAVHVRTAQRHLIALRSAGLAGSDAGRPARWWRSEGLAASGCATETAAGANAA